MQAVFASPLPWESTTEKPVVNILVSWLQGIQMYACAWLALLSLEPCAIKLASCFQAFFFWGGGIFGVFLCSSPTLGLPASWEQPGHPRPSVRTPVLLVCLAKAEY